MSIIPSIRSHAQNRHYRRIANREAWHGPQWGTPIPGELTPTEIAHKARRRLRRVVILKERINSLQAVIETTTKVKLDNEKFNTAEAKRIVNLAETDIKTHNKHLQSAKDSLSRLF